MKFFSGYTTMIELYNALKFITLLLFIQKILTFNLGVAFLKVREYISLVVRKPVFEVSDQVRREPGCAVTEDG